MFCTFANPQNLSVGGGVKINIVMGVALHQIFGGGIKHVMKKWTQQDLRFCKNEGSKRSNNNEKGGQQDQKSRRKLAQFFSSVK